MNNARVGINASTQMSAGSGGGGEAPDNVLTMNGEPLMLNGKYITLGAADMSIDITNPGADAADLTAALASLLSMVVDPDTGRIGIGVNDISELQSGRLTIKPSSAALGSELIANGSFTGNADEWSLGDGWTYAGNEVTYTPGDSATAIEQTIDSIARNGYRVTGTINAATDGEFLHISILGSGGAATNVPVVNGDFSADIIAGADGLLSIVSLDNLFDGTIDDVSCKAILSPTVLSLLHADASLAVKHDTSISGGGEISVVKINTDDTYSITPGNYFALRQNPIDGDTDTILNHYYASAETNVRLPVVDGTLVLKTFASDTFTTVDLKTVTVADGVITGIAS